MNEEALFAAALEKSTPSDRQAFLEIACAGDVALRRRVERLLAAHLETFGILDEPAIRPRTTGAAPESPPSVLSAGESWHSSSSRRVWIRGPCSRGSRPSGRLSL